MGRLGRYFVQAIEAVTTMAAIRRIIAIIQNRFAPVPATIPSRYY
jgi:hypothetical protein